MHQSAKEAKDNSNESSTDLYRKENEYVLGLPRVVASGQARKAYPDSVMWLIFKKFSSLKVILRYVIQVITQWRWIKKTWHLKGRGVETDVIVIGNGPSQGFIAESNLLRFKENGGELICINFWTENPILCNVNPTCMVTSDEIIFSSKIPPHLKEKHEKLMSYMLSNETITIACPLDRCSELSAIFGKNRVFGFVDLELRMWTSNIHLLFPRGYLSMTLYKALAVAIWFNYKIINIIGMDNTYPRNIYCSESNKFMNHEVHANGGGFVVDQSAIYHTVGDALAEMTRIFHDIQKFKNPKIINLDRYSLTDAFKKLNSLVGDKNHD